MTRSIGDHEARQIGVICDPVITKTEIYEEAKAVVLGSDGLYEYLSNKEIQEFISSNISMAAEEIASSLCE